ncbi:hypothetical protein, partial [Hungatella effluvii]|uniref:hypothetical protein n=1 Tax=Hungatella effluvii TaxID=1096246 RepID=UPI002A7EDFE3
TYRLYHKTNEITTVISFSPSSFSACYGKLREIFPFLRKNDCLKVLQGVVKYSQCDTIKLTRSVKPNRLRGSGR